MASFRNALILGLFATLQRVIKILPRGVAFSWGKTLGILAYNLLTTHHQRAKEHIKIAFPHFTEEAVSRLAKENFVHYGLTLVELFRLEETLQKVTLRGWENLLNRPCILITGHIGNWELLAQALGRKGFPLYALARKAQLKGLNAFLVKLRARGGVETILRGHPSGPKKMLQAIRNEGILGFLIDQDTKVEGVFVPFFGRLAHTPVGPAKLALKYDLPIITAFLQRQKDGSHQGSFSPPLYPQGYDPISLTALLTSRIEEAIRKDPAQWVWVHRRWKKRPLDSGNK